MNKYWNRIDLHFHTNHDIDCRNNHITSNYTHHDFYEYLKVEKLKLKAVTCHNNIELPSHIKHALICELLKVNYLVGVEIDYCFDDTEFQAISILSPNVDIIKFSNSLNDIRKGKGNDIHFSKEDFCKLHEETEFIFIPHAIKTKGILYDKPEDLDTNCIDWIIKSIKSGLGEPILFENTKDFHIYTVANKIEYVIKNKHSDLYSSYVGQDFKFDEDQQRKQRILNRINNEEMYAIFSEPTYRGLEIAIRNYKTRFSEEKNIVNTDKFIEKIEIHDSTNFNNSAIDFSPGLNVIIGNSGTGKTLLLNEIIYNLKGRNLKDFDKYSRKGENIYKNKLGKDFSINIKIANESNFKDVNLIDIPNIYQMFLKNQDFDVLSSFGLGDLESESKIINTYKGKINCYLNNLKRILNLEINGNQNINNIKSSTEFIYKNDLKDYFYKLEEINYDSLVLNKIVSKISLIDDSNKRIDESIVFLENLNKVVELKETKEDISKLITYYENLKINLIKELDLLKKQEQKEKIEFKIVEKINNVIRLNSLTLGNKEVAVKERRKILNLEISNLINNIKNCLKSEKENEDISLVFPYEEILEILQTNSNDYARLTFDLSKDELENVEILNSRLFNLTNYVTKIKNKQLNEINFLNDSSIKTTINILNEENINFNSIFLSNNAVPKNIELFLNNQNEWKSIKQINKGDIAKKAIEYYFEKSVKEKQPNIILIDQPENDVDKTFISETLSEFLKKQKINSQIIITSHEALIAINSDANKIIEAKIGENNKFKYDSYNLEDVDHNIFIGTEKVSKILDGGKKNIKLRYQVYGGELNYGNKNI